MANPEHVKIVKQGAEAIRKWREANVGDRLDLCDANLARADLRRADLRGADLRRADLTRADLSGAELSRANLSGANALMARFGGADLTGADLSRANLCGANALVAKVGGADLTCAHLTRGDLRGANLRGANLSKTDLREAFLLGASLRQANLAAADLTGAFCQHTLWADLDLSVVSGLDRVRHSGPSSLGVDTLARSKGRIPEVFLRGCGLSPWEVEAAKLYDPDFKPAQIAEIQNRVFELRTQGPLFIGDIFISYSHADGAFVDKLQKALYDEGANVWRDVHKMTAGPLERQVFDAIRINDVVLLVLSKDSVGSDWVEAELEKALQKEKQEQRDVLCPVALDDSWQAKTKEAGSTVLWRQVLKKNIVDFSQWSTAEFEPVFRRKLLPGIKTYY